MIAEKSWWLRVAEATDEAAWASDPRAMDAWALRMASVSLRPSPMRRICCPAFCFSRTIEAFCWVVRPVEDGMREVKISGTVESPVRISTR